NHNAGDRQPAHRKAQRLQAHFPENRGPGSVTIANDREQGVDLGLKGRRVLVTGGSQGIGYAVAKGFLEEGAHVTIVARDPTGLREASARLSEVSKDQLAAHSVD